MLSIAHLEVIENGNKSIAEATNTKKQVQATENSKAKNKADALIAQAMYPEHVQQQETEEFQREPRPVDLFNPAEEYSKGESTTTD